MNHDLILDQVLQVGDVVDLVQRCVLQEGHSLDLLLAFVWLLEYWRVFGPSQFLRADWMRSNREIFFVQRVSDGEPGVRACCLHVLQLVVRVVTVTRA